MEINLNHPKTGPRDVFMYLLTMGTLYASAVMLITLWFAYIDALFPDPLSYCFNCGFDQIRWASSGLLVVFPVFLFMFWKIRKEFTVEPERRELKIRKWLIYLTLFVASVTIIVDLVVLIYNFYGGDLTTKFLLKILAVLAVALAVFSYFLWDIKSKEAASGKTKTIVYSAAVLVLTTLIGGFFIAGSPSVQRDRRFDERRVNDLQNIQWRVVDYWTKKGELPKNTDELKDNISGFTVPVDPQTGQAYEYKVTGVTSFELCAEFKQRSEDPKSPTLRPVFAPINYEYNNNNWEHKTGRSCFVRNIDPALYKPEKLKPY